MNDSVTAWFNAAGKRKLTKEQTLDLFVKLREQRAVNDTDGSLQTLNRICEGNLLLVISAVKSYKGKITHRFRFNTNDELFLDLLQVGYTGLRSAAEKFDLTRGNRFSTVALPWIFQKIGRHLIEKEQSIYIPEGCIREMFYYKKHGKGSGRRHAPKSLSYLNAAANAYNVGSLDVKIKTDQSTGTLMDLIPSLDDKDLESSPAEILQQIKDIMAKAMIPPSQQDLMIAYARVGRVQSAARSIGHPVGSAGKKIKGIIEKLQAYA